MTVLLFGENHRNILSLIRSLGELNHHIILLLKENKFNYVDKSKYIKECYHINEDTEVIDIIKKLSKNWKVKPLLLTSGDKEATFINSNQEELNKYCFVEGGIYNNDINKYRDKTQANNLAISCGFQIPQTITLDSPEEKINEELFPIIVKPNNSINGGKSILKKFDKKNDFEFFINNMNPSWFPIQVQCFIDKEYEIMLQGCALFNSDDVLIPVSQHKIRFYPTIYSAGSYSYSVETESNENLKLLAEKVKSYINKINYSGMFSAEFLFSKGTYYFLEINFRNDATMMLSTRSGFNLPHYLCQSCENKKVYLKKYTFKKVYFMDTLLDFRHVLKRNINVFVWLKQFVYSYSYYFDKKDMKPAFYYYISIIRKKIEK